MIKRQQGMIISAVLFLIFMNTLIYFAVGTGLKSLWQSEIKIKEMRQEIEQSY